MRVFVTGANGFIGRHVVRRLVRAGHEVRGLVTAPEKRPNVEALGAEAVVGDVADGAAVRDAVRGCDAVVHLASIYRFWPPDRREFRRVNVDGARNVVEAAAAAGAKKLVHVSSAVVWGRPAQTPFREETPYAAARRSAYAESKHEQDRVVRALAREKALPLVVLYPAAVTGADDPKTSAGYVRDYAAGKVTLEMLGGSMTTWVHVDDVAEAIAAALGKDLGPEARYILAGERATFRQLNALLSEVTGVPVPTSRLPDWVVLALACAATAVARLTGGRPWQDLDVEGTRTLLEGVDADGGKAARELGLTYTPLRRALEEIVAAQRGAAGRLST